MLKSLIATLAAATILAPTAWAEPPSPQQASSILEETLESLENQAAERLADIEPVIEAVEAITSLNEEEKGLAALLVAGECSSHECSNVERCAIVQTAVNRVRSEHFGDSLKEVLFERTPSGKACQFSWACSSKALARAKALAPQFRPLVEDFTAGQTCQKVPVMYAEALFFNVQGSRPAKRAQKIHGAKTIHTFFALRS